MLSSSLASLLFALGPALAAAQDGTFKEPAARSRPRFRYWLPDASVDKDTVVNDLKAAGDIGAGGTEFIPFYNYGGNQGSAPEGSDWAKYGFGTESFHEMFKLALRTHAENGLYMDFPLGPNQGQGVPAEYGDEGLQWNLLGYSAEVPANGSFAGVIPGWGSGELVASTTALALFSEDKFRVSQDFSGSRNLTWAEYRLAHKSLRDVTDKVDPSNGQVGLEFPEVEGTARYRVFAFYQTQEHYNNLRFDNTGLVSTESIFDNGSYVVDHHSARGAQTLIDFWEKRLLDDETLELIEKAGNFVWEDSVEIRSNVTWTPSLPDKFKALHGYDIRPFLPLLVFDQNSIYAQRYTFGPFKGLLDTPYEGLGYVHDYRAALEVGYNEYVSTLRNWSNSRLGLPYSNQPTYGLPHDMTATIPLVDIPEYESLAFGDGIDNYRRFVGTAHLAGKNIISNELGAVVLHAYRQTLVDVIHSVHLAVIGGTNQLILHGQTFSGEWYGTTWPGYTPFQYLFSELYSPKQPAWENGMAEIMEYFARLQFVQRQGVPRTDVAVLSKVSRTYEKSPPLYPADDLEKNGWTYSYLSPHGFSLPQAYVENGLLGPDGPAWKAVVVQSTENLTSSDVRTLRGYSEAGLPVILSGGTPRYWATRSSCDKKLHAREVERLVDSENVHVVDKGEVASKLWSLGLRPRVQVTSPATVHTTWREDAANGVSYAFLLNDNDVSVSGDAVFQTPGRPFILDGWTGEEHAVLEFRTSDDGLQVPVELAPGQALIIAVRKDEAVEDDTPRCHFTQLPDGVLGVAGKDDELVVQVSAASKGDGTLDSGSQVSLSPPKKVAEAAVLSGWTLTAENWSHPADMSDLVTIAAKTNTTKTMDKLTSWLEIDELKNSMGVGYYSNSFNWSSSDTSGAYLKVSGVTHTVRVLVNGEVVDPFDHQNGIRDISGHLVDGVNNVLLIAPTPMWSYLITLADEIRESGGRPRGLVMAASSPALFPSLGMGLDGDVTLVPYEKVTVACV